LYRRDLTVSSLKPAVFNVSNQQSTSCAHATGITIFFAMAARYHHAQITPEILRKLVEGLR
jgi:hypothetical protein